jgi:mRNA-degrading endonuclease RelE of RelBE toxin-antitoxin system
MSYKVLILRRAQKEMAELSAGDFERVDKKLRR